MTNLLKKAIIKTSELPDDEQNKIAQIILDEIEVEKKWSLQFKNTQDELLILAEKALNSKTINKL
jgi:hypothetical protein